MYTQKNNLETSNLIEQLNSRGVHPYANVFPYFDFDNIRKLSDDIKAQGQLEPIKTRDNLIIDGRNRYMACILANVEPVFSEITNNNVLEYIIGYNLCRRQLNQAQRAWAGANLVLEHDISRQKACDLMSISLRSLNSAISVKRNGIEKLRNILAAGKIAVSLAEKVANFNEIEQKTMLKRPKKDIKKSIDEATNALNDKNHKYSIEITISFTEDEIKKIDTASRKLSIGGRNAFIHRAATQCSSDWLPPTKEEIYEMFNFRKPKFIKKRYSPKMQKPDGTGLSEMERDYIKEEEEFYEEYPNFHFDNFLDANNKKKIF